jgi:hypothetical protein
MHEYAIRFEPSSGASSIRADVYLRTVEATLEAITSIRASLSPRIALQHGWPANQVRQALEFSIGPTKKGSLIVPLVPGATAKGAPLGADGIALTFWREMGSELGRVKGGREATCVSGNAADALARASAAAKEANAKLSLATRSSRGTWHATAAITGLERALRRHAERRKTGHDATMALTGRIVSLTFEPPSVVLASGDVKQTVLMPASLRAAAKECWGDEVVVDVAATLSADGDVTAPRAIRIRRAATAEAAAKTFDQTFGALRDLLGDQEAKDYIASLRGGTH